MPTRKGHDVEEDNFDRGIVPAETAARKEREGDDYKTTPKGSEEGGDETTDGYTTSNEGLTNNYAVEPEMYVETPGDLESEGEPHKAEKPK